MGFKSALKGLKVVVFVVVVVVAAATAVVELLIMGVRTPETC